MVFLVSGEMQSRRRELANGFRPQADDAEESPKNASSPVAMLHFDFESMKHSSHEK